MVDPSLDIPRHIHSSGIYTWCKQVTYGKTNSQIYGIVQGTIVFLSDIQACQAGFIRGHGTEDTVRMHLNISFKSLA